MNISIRDVLSLNDNNKYMVISKAYYDGKDYIYIMDINNSKNLKFCCIEDDELVEVTDKELNTKLLPLFFNQSKDIFLKEFSQND